MFGRKGQGAMEYLMTYGWAILVVMIVGIVMWQLGIFNPSGTQSITMQGFGAIKPQLAGTGLSADGQFTGTFLNAGGAKIAVRKVKVTVSDPTIAGASITYTASEREAAANKHVTAVVVVTSGSLGGAGDAYSATVEITYDVTIGAAQVSKKSSGIVRGPLE